MNKETCSEPRVDLVEDVKRTVLDYISLSSDLKALCMVNRSWHDVATKYLYKNIVLDIRFRDGQLSTFDRCLQHGALKHLQHARNLALLDRSKDSPSLTVCGDHVIAGGSLWKSAAERNEMLLHILHQFPEHELRGFSYISEDELNSACLENINKSQQSIQSMHITKCDVRQLVSSSRSRLTVGFDGDEQKTNGLLEIAQALPLLDSLHLITWSGWTNAVSKYWDDPHPHSLSSIRKIMAKKLILTGYMPGTFTRNTSSIIDWSMVTSLTLLKCDEWPLDRLANITELQHLKRFHLNSSAYMRSEHIINLHRLFTNNLDLQNLHLGLRDLATACAESRPGTIDRVVGYMRDKAYLWPLRHRLKTLSLHDSVLYHNYDDVYTALGTFFLPTFEYVCQDFPHLQQLGIQPPRDWSLGSQNTLLRNYLTPIKFLKDLRMLHLYQQRLMVVPSYHIRGKDAIAFEIQSFVDSFFQWTDSECPSLTLFIWGMTGAPNEAEAAIVREICEAGDYTYERIPRFVFVKRHRMLRSGRMQAYAAPISPGKLREDYPELELLSYDAEDSDLDLITEQTGW